MPNIRITIRNANGLEQDLEVQELTIRGSAQPAPSPTPAPAPVPAPAPAPAPTPATLLGAFGVGINLHEANYYSAPWVFTDAWRHASGWVSDQWGAYATAPGRDGSEHVLAWTGNGVLAPEGTAVSIAPNSVRFRPPANRHFTVRRTGNVSGITLVRAADIAITGLIHPAYVASLHPFRAQRFLEIADVNSSTTATWAQRVTGDRYVQGRGISYETQLEICRLTGGVPWLPVPHLADDDYARQLATLIAANSTGPVIVEYSNEVWNGQFTQQAYAQAEGLRLGLATNAFEACLRFQVRRSQEIWAIMRPILGARLLRVLSGQHSVPSNTALMLAAAGPGGCDAFAVAPYFTSDAGVPPVLQLVAQQKACCVAAGVPLVAYEGGPHFPAATNAHPGIYDTTRALLDGWRSAGGGLFCYFADCYRPHPVHGAWGALEEQTQPIGQAPKMRALLDAIAAP